MTGFSATRPVSTWVAALKNRQTVRSPLDQHPENIERPRAERHRHINTALVAPKQTAAAPIEAEVIEQKNVLSGERVHGCISHAHPIFQTF